VANKIRQWRKLANNATNYPDGSISSSSQICKNTPEICKVNRRRLSVDRELRSLAVDSPLKKSVGVIGRDNEKLEEELFQPNLLAKKETGRVS